VEVLLLVIYIVGIFAIIIPLWVLPLGASAHAVFTEFSNVGGWSTTGTVLMIGCLGPSPRWPASTARFTCVSDVRLEFL
jgi:choline transport protein